MTSRSIYQSLLRMHPAGFRSRYEDQMLWIFDESVRSRGAVSLLFDAAVSLFRQWILRSGNWRRGKSGLAIAGASTLSDPLRRNSQRLYRQAWWLNAFWVVGALLVFFLCPLPFAAKSQLSFLGIWTIVAYLRNMKGRSPAEVAIVRPLDIYRNSQSYYRTRLEEKRDGLRAWGGKIDGAGGSIGFVLLFTALFLVLLIRPIIQNYQGLPNAGWDWDHSRWFVYGMCAMLYFWRFVKKLSERAAESFQQEIDAMDGPPQAGKI